MLIDDPSIKPTYGKPVVDLRDYRRALGGFATGICVVTARAADGHGTGLTINSFASVSLEPPLVSWCLFKHSSTRSVFDAASHFAINVLAVDQLWLSDHFAKSGGDKLAGIDTKPGLGDVPLLDGCVARFECLVRERLEGGDHLIFLGEVVRYARWKREPLLYCFGGYAYLTTKDDGDS